ncbi:hypothetical protein Tco_1180271 [Tanacetum coccineum]
MCTCHPDIKGYALNLTYCYGFKRLDITSNSVKNLVFRGYANYEDEFGNDAYIIKINAPYLLSLAIQKHLFLWKLILLNVSSLVKANLDYDMSEQEAEEEEVHKEFILSLRNVKDLIIGDSCEKQRMGGTNARSWSRRNIMNSVIDYK